MLSSSGTGRGFPSFTGLASVQLLDHLRGQISCIADIDNGGELGASLSADLENVVDSFLLRYFSNNYSDIVEELAGDYNHAFAEDLELGGMILLMFALESGILMIFYEETPVILLALVLYTGWVLHAALQVAEFHLKELKGLRPRILIQCPAGIPHSIPLYLGEVVRLECFCDIDGAEMGPASLEGWA